MSESSTETTKTQPTRAEQLAKQLEELRAKKAKREEARKEAELEKAVQAEIVDAQAEELADKLVADGKVRGLDFEVVTCDGRVVPISRTPGPAWERFQKYAAKDEPIPPEQYRNAARASLIEVEDGVTKDDFDKLCSKFPNLAVTIVNDYLLPMNKGRVAKREGK